jgi:hypothetical protein
VSGKVERDNNGNSRTNKQAKLPLHVQQASIVGWEISLAEQGDSSAAIPPRWKVRSLVRVITSKGKISLRLTAMRQLDTFRNSRQCLFGKAPACKVDRTEWLRYSSSGGARLRNARLPLFN